MAVTGITRHLKRRRTQALEFQMTEADLSHSSIMQMHRKRRARSTGGHDPDAHQNPIEVLIASLLTSAMRALIISVL